MKRIPIIFYILLTTCSLSNCARQLTHPINNNSSTISINFSVYMQTQPFTWEQVIPRKVFFIKLDNNKSLKQKHIFYSNSVSAGVVYLLNAEPGKYAAVGAHGWGRYTEKDIAVFFPENLVKSTIVNVKQGHLSYMGKFVMDTAPMNNALEKADHIQLHYYTLLTGRHRRSDAIIEYILGDKYAISPLKEKYVDKQFKMKHLRARKNDSSHQHWKTAIEKEILFLEEKND